MDTHVHLVFTIRSFSILAQQQSKFGEHLTPTPGESYRTLASQGNRENDCASVVFGLTCMYIYIHKHKHTHTHTDELALSCSTVLERWSSHAYSGMRMLHVTVVEALPGRIDWVDVELKILTCEGTRVKWHWTGTGLAHWAWGSCGPALG